MQIKSESENSHCWQEYSKKGTFTKGGDIVCFSLYENSFEILKKLIIEFPSDSVILLLGIYPRNTSSLIWKDICTAVFIAALHIPARI